MSRLLQIKEDDLATLERTLPQLAEALVLTASNRHRVQLRQVQQILSSVRWNYGPALEAEAVSGDEDSPTP